MDEAVATGYNSNPSSHAHQAKQRNRDHESPDGHDLFTEERHMASTFASQRQNDVKGVRHIIRTQITEPQDEALSKIENDSQGRALIGFSRGAHQERQLIGTPEDLREGNSQIITRNDNAKKPSGGVFHGIASYLRSDRTEEPSNNIENRIANLEAELRCKDTELKKAEAHIHEQGIIHQHRVKELKQKWKNQCKAIWQESSHFEVQFKTTAAQLEVAKKEIEQQEAVITSIRGRQISDLASDVSNDLPDDKVREALRVFFQGDFFSWCSDLCAPELREPDQVAARLRSMHLLSTNEAYLRSPEFLRLDLKLGDGEASLPLLQGALSSFLCREFLTSPYFLADINAELHGGSQVAPSSALTALESTFLKMQPEVAMDWRINTLQTLERSMPMTTEAAEYLATVFLENFQFLINDVYWDDKDAKTDLIKMVLSFASLSLRLWQKRGNINVHYINDFANVPFQWRSPLMDADPQALATLGAQTDGRPIALLMRPGIVSLPLRRSDDVQAEISWLRALAWISSRVDGDETMGQ
ncbi:unnamed protein product [Clonostachys rosea]|uniref:Uncharacterized protein n=1 Tax=Bionectria ochroleuca TaxID=29856 RepID=A0ABY6UII4_BIOOC|nr:unnamed protein product [Clonostachys rosea]